MTRTAPVRVDWRLTALSGDGVAHRLGDHGRAHEYAVLSHLAAVGGVPAVPRPVGTVTLDADTFAVYPWCGTDDLQRLLPLHGGPPRPPGYDTGSTAATAHAAEGQAAAAHAADRLAAVLADVGRALAALHAAPPPEPGPRWRDEPALLLLDRTVDPGEYTLHEFDRALDRAAAGGFLPEATRAPLADLRAAPPDLRGSRLALVHFDLHPRNVRIEVRGGEPIFAGLIDFKNAHYWLPEFDLATMAWHLTGLPPAVRAAFHTGYGAGADPGLVRYCEAIRLVFVLANGARRQPEWVTWCQRRLTEVLDEVPVAVDGGV